MDEAGVEEMTVSEGEVAVLVAAVVGWLGAVIEVAAAGEFVEDAVVVVIEDVAYRPANNVNMVSCWGNPCSACHSHRMRMAEVVDLHC